MELDDEDETRKLKKQRTVRTDVELDDGASSSVGRATSGKEEVVKLPKSRGQVILDQVQGNKDFFYGVGRRGRDAQVQEAKDC
jgi:hypothetical protein